MRFTVFKNPVKPCLPSIFKWVQIKGLATRFYLTTKGTLEAQRAPMPFSRGLGEQ